MREKLFNKENLKPVIVLSVICLVVAALMGGVNMITAPIIKEAEEQKVYDSLREVLDGKFEPAELPDGAPSTVKAIYKVSEGEELIGHVVTLEKQGYASKIALTVGIDADGKTTKVVITAQQETHGKNIAPLLDALSAGIGADEVSDVEAVSGATKTSDFIKAAVADAFSVLGFGGGSHPGDDDNAGGGEEDGETLPKTDEQIKEICNGMLSEPQTLTDISLNDAPDALKRAYSAGDSGYFLYIVVPGDYVPVATEAAVHLDNTGKIVKVNLLQWVVGHEVGPDGFADRFIGADKDTAGDVELVTGATGTSSDFRDAIKTSLEYFAESQGLVEQLPTSDEQVKAIAAQMAGKELSLSELEIKGAPETLKRAYNASEDGYFLYIVVPGDYVPVATEAVVWLDAECKVQKVNLLQWVVGHGVGPDGFADRFIGTDKDSAGEVELVTGATGTSSDFRDALVAAVITVSDGDNARENLLIKRMEALVPGAESFESVEIPTNAKQTLKKLYKVAGRDGYVAYIITSTKYVAVETECLVYINAAGKVGNIDLITWTVGHGVEPGEFASSMIGKTKEELADVELVTSATVTAGNLRDAVADAIAVVPTDYTPVIIGAAVIAVALISVAALIIIKRRKNR